MNRRDEVVELMKELRKIMTLEEIATEVMVAYPTAYAWSRGSRRPSKLTQKALVALYVRRTEKEV